MKHLKNRKFIALLVSFFAVAAIVMKLYPQESMPLPVMTVKKIEHKKIITAEAEQFLISYDKQLKSLMEEANTPGAAVVIVKDSTIIYMKGLGTRASNTDEKVDVNTVFRIASVSKCFASTLTGILVQDKTLSWDDKITQYLPEFCLKSQDQTAELSIRNVLSHTTGLPYHTFTSMVEDGTDLNTMLSRLSEVDLCNKVGTTYSYQNVVYSVIGEVMKSATGKSYESLVKEKIFQPLHMNRASISYDDIMHDDNIALPHHKTRRGCVPAKITNTYYNVAPAGGINASISDMAQWLIALMGNRQNVITETTLDQMFTPQVKARSKNRNYGKKNHVKGSYYALGWRVLHYPNDTIVYHGGFVNGYRSEVAIDRKDKIAICVLANAPGEFADNSVPMFFNMYFENRDGIRSWFDDTHQQSKHNAFASIK